MTLTAVHHTGLIVRDLDRSIYFYHDVLGLDFYHDVLGLDFYNEPTPWFEGPELERGVGVPGAKLRQVTFWVGPNCTLELLEYANRPASSTAPVPNNYLGAAHVCFKVDDVWAKKAELESQGVRFYSDVNVVDEGPLAGWRWVYFSDPDGLALELNQIDYYHKDERDKAAAEYLRSRSSLAEVEPRLA